MHEISQLPCANYLLPIIFLNADELIYKYNVITLNVCTLIKLNVILL